MLAGWIVYCKTKNKNNYLKINPSLCIVLPSLARNLKLKSPKAQSCGFRSTMNLSQTSDSRLALKFDVSVKLLAFSSMKYLFVQFSSLGIKLRYIYIYIMFHIEKSVRLVYLHGARQWRSAETLLYSYSILYINSD